MAQRGPGRFANRGGDGTWRRRLRRRCLAPVEGAGHQLDGGGIHDMDEAFETESRISGGGCRQRAELQSLQMIQHRPEQLLGHLRVAGAISVGQRVFRPGPSPHAAPTSGPE